MGNVQCGDLCNGIDDKKEIIQVHVTPGENPSDWNKENQKTQMPDNNIVSFKFRNSNAFSQHQSIIGQNNHNQNKAQVIDWVQGDKTSFEQGLVTPVEVRMQQKHYIVPHNLVMSRVSEKSQLLLKKQFSTSPLIQQDARWYLLKSGNYYNGQLKQQQPYGIGTYILPDKIFYGQTSKGKPQGMGVIIHDNYVFKGEFHDGKGQGQATIQSQNYNFKGVFKDGQMIRGKIITRQYVYEGNFLNNLPSGQGVYNNNRLKITYQGFFLNGKFHGKGNYSCQHYSYKGLFQNGMKQGEGSIEFFKSNMKNKKGIWSQDKLIKDF